MNIFLILPIIAVSLMTIPIILSESQVSNDIPFQMVFKVVLLFESPNTEQEIRTAFEDIQQDILDRGIDKLGSSIDNMNIRIVSLDVTDQGGGKWTVYPKIVIDGIWTGPPQTIGNRFDDYETSLKGIFNPVINGLGGSGASWHYHDVDSIQNNMIVQISVDEVL